VELPSGPKNINVDNGNEIPKPPTGEVLSRQISVTRNVCLPKRRDSKNWINRMENVPDVGKKRPLTRRMDITRRGMPMAAKPGPESR